ncbi:MAG: hypothetical protein H7Y88_04390 [Phycisphaerales bacterium]|nr:hypothetical protein [Phycisphaerales bacterium]
MNEIKLVLRKAALRLFLSSLLRGLVWAAAVVLGGLILARLVEKMGRFDFPWELIGYGAAGAWIVGGLAWGVFTLADRRAVARRVDDGADLREAISSALCVAGSQDPWARLTVESASEKARKVNVAQAVPIRAPRFWQTPAALGLVFVIVFLTVPELGKGAEAKAKEEEQKKIAEAVVQVEEAKSRVEDLASKLGITEDEVTAETDLPEKPRSADDVRRSAIKQLTSIKDRLAELKKGETGEKVDALKKALSQLKVPGEGPLTELSKELAKGNFKQAQIELQKLAENAKNLTPEQKAALEKQLKELAAQLDKLAEEKKDLENKLEKAGLDKNLAADPEALKKALEKMSNLSEEQKKELMKQAEAAKQCSGACKNMAASMSKMSQAGGQSGQEGQEGMEGMEGLSQQLSELEQMAGEMNMADAAMSEATQQLEALAAFNQCENPGMGECEGGLCQNPGTRPWSAGEKYQQGRGSGGPGQGAGGAPGEKEAAANLDKQKFKTKTQQGPIISSRMVQGEQVRGESVAEFAGAVAAAEQEAAEALEDNVIPREYHDVVKHYFGNLKAKAKAQEVKAEGGSTAPAASDAAAPASEKK